MLNCNRNTEHPAPAPAVRPVTAAALGVLLMLGPALSPALAATTETRSRIDAIAAQAESSSMMPVAEGFFFMGTARTGHESFSLTLQYDDTEQPQRRIRLDRYEIDRDEVSLSEFLRWLTQRHQPIPVEIHTLIEHVMTVHALTPDTLARWPALYVTWTEAADFCLAQGKRLPTEAEWEKAARGEQGQLFPWGQQPPTPALAMFGQYHVHEIPIVASVRSGEEGRSPYGLHHMAGNAAEWVADWFGIDYYMTMPERNPPGPAAGRYKVIRGGTWKSTPALLRSATRSGAPPEQRAATIGFRCARSIQ
ncbi:MAG TPA: SUMF1/EgtB/PvdO family nonheme iron enzyme [Nitrospira sp.]